MYSLNAPPKFEQACMKQKERKSQRELFSCITHQYKSVIEKSEVWKSKTKDKMQFSASR